MVTPSSILTNNKHGNRWRAAALAMCMLAGNACASSDAGIEIHVGNFQVNVYYSDALDYHNEADRTIRDPGEALFTLAALMQANAPAFAVTNHVVQAELYTRAGSPGNSLLVTEDPQSRSVVLRDGPVGPDVVQAIVDVICQRYAGACSQPALKRVVLYPCQKATCPGQVRFGAFPSTSINKRFGLLRPQGGASQISVSRQDIGRYFEALDP